MAESRGVKSDEKPISPERVWDQFIDALDRAGQAGGAQDVIVPTFASGGLGGRPFGELTRDDVKQLARVAGGLGRRDDIVVTLWNDMQQRKRGPRKNQRKRR